MRVARTLVARSPELRNCFERVLATCSNTWNRFPISFQNSSCSNRDCKRRHYIISLYIYIYIYGLINYSLFNYLSINYSGVNSSITWVFNYYYLLLSIYYQFGGALSQLFSISFATHGCASRAFWLRAALSCETVSKEFLQHVRTPGTVSLFHFRIHPVRIEIAKGDITLYHYIYIYMD